MSEELGSQSTPPTSAPPSRPGPRSTAAPLSAAAPRKRWHLLRSDAFPLVLVTLLSVGGLAVLWSIAAGATVHFVNALSGPLHIDVDGSTLEVGAGSRTERRLDVGLHQVRVRAGDKVIEESVVYVPRFHDALIYDPLGLKIIVERRVRYTTALSPTDNDDDTKVHVGRRWVVVREADYVFRDPPQQISTKQSGGSIVKVWIDAPADATWRETLSYLMSSGAQGSAATVLQRWLAAPPEWIDPEAPRWAPRILAATDGPAGNLDQARQARAQAPETREAHVAYQEAMLLLGARQALLAEYRERTARSADSVVEMMARMRVEPIAESERLLAEARARFPDDPTLRLIAANDAYDRGDPPEALRLYASVPIASMDPAWAPSRAAALAATGKASEALQMVDEVLARTPTALALLLTRAQLAALPGVPAVDPRMPDEPTVAAYLRSLLGGPRPAKIENTLDATTTLQVAILEGPSAGRAAAASTSAIGLAQLHRPLAVLLSAEMERIGDAAAAERVRRQSMDARIERAQLLAFILDGVRDPELVRLDDESLAALEIVRARVLLESGDTRGAQAMVETAKKRDVLRGPPTRVLEAWPAPGKGDGTLVTFAWRRTAR
ncbi:MAG: hypothetical protein WKG00_34515 [Polyangiaceae bacterium]